MGTSNVIPKEKLPIYERWTLDTFELADKANSNVNTQPTEETEPSEPEESNGKKLLDEEQVNEIYRQAKEEGHAAGFTEGHAAGHQEGTQLAEIEVKAEVERMHVLLSGLNKELKEIDQKVAHDLLALALDLSKKMVTKALQVRPELIIPVIQEAMRHLPHTSHHPHLILHPDDAVLIRKHLGDQLSQSDWEICEDEQTIKGGCRIKTTGSEIDASVSTRWQQILATIGQEDNWIEQSPSQSIDND